MNRKSRRFSPNVWTERLVPVVLAFLALALLATLIVVGLSIAGMTPSG